MRKDGDWIENDDWKTQVHITDPPLCVDSLSNPCCRSPLEDADGWYEGPRAAVWYAASAATAPADPLPPPHAFLLRVSVRLRFSSRGSFLAAIATLTERTGGISWKRVRSHVQKQSGSTRKKFYFKPKDNPGDILHRVITSRHSGRREDQLDARPAAAGAGAGAGAVFGSEDSEASGSGSGSTPANTVTSRKPPIGASGSSSGSGRLSSNGSRGSSRGRSSSRSPSSHRYIFHEDCISSLLWIPEVLSAVHP